MARRQAGMKLPPGHVKTVILLYIAQHGEAQFRDIRTLLNKEFNIVNLKTIRTHLEDLEKEYIDTVKPHPEDSEKYQINIYRIKPGFTTFQKMYNRFHDQLPSLMKTKYFQDYVKSGDITLKLLYNIPRVYLSDQGRLHNVYDKLTKVDPTGTLGKRLMAAAQILLSHDSDEMPQAITSWLSEQNPTVNYTLFNEILLDNLIPLYERGKILDSLLIAPPAVEFIFTPEFPDPILLATMFSHMLTSQALDQEYFTSVIGNDIKRIPRLDNESMLLAMIKCKVENAIIDKTIIKTEYTEPILDRLLPKTSVKT